MERGEATMDLKQNQITLGELLKNPGARALLTRRFPKQMRRLPPAGPAQTVTLEQLLAFLKPYVPEKILRDTLAELKQLP
ncbi:MAG: hypothetical protein LUD69_09415 [Oscillospiraceae bacterium]|nr:hypothetical protein [Oscillospiraceae bacterium]MCD8377148.1 hypothetical protein [Oscillospiraceae bacterium]